MTSRFALHRDRWLRAGAAALLAGLLPARAYAQGQMALAWEAPAECPQEPAVRQKLRTLAGDAWHTTEHVSAKGRIERLDGRYRLTVTVREGEAVKERTIVSDSCVDLAGAAAVTLGLLLGNGPGASDAGVVAGTSDTAAGPGGAEKPGAGGDANARAASTGAAAAKQGAAAEQPAKNAASKADDDSSAGGREGGPSDPRSQPRRLSAVVRAPLLTLDLARLPQPSIGLGGGIGARYAAWRFIASGRILKDQTLWSETSPDVGSRVSRFSVELAACRGFRDGALELAPCLTLGLDHLTARGTGPPNVTRQSQRSLSFLLGGALAAHLYVTDWLAVFAGAGLAVATSSPRFVVEGLGEVGHTGPVQISIGMGPEWIF